MSEHYLAPIRRSKNIPIHRIRQILIDRYDRSISVGRLSMLLAGISPMPSDLEQQIASILEVETKERTNVAN